MVLISLSASRSHRARIDLSIVRSISASWGLLTSRAASVPSSGSSFLPASNSRSSNSHESDPGCHGRYWRHSLSAGGEPFSVMESQGEISLPSLMSRSSGKDKPGTKRFGRNGRLGSPAAQTRTPASCEVAALMLTSQEPLD